MLKHTTHATSLSSRSMGEFVDVENYLSRRKYLEGITMGEKANLRRKCRNNYKIEAGTLYYRKCAAQGEEPWKISARSEEKRILESCHTGPIDAFGESV